MLGTRMREAAGGAVIEYVTWSFSSVATSAGTDITIPADAVVGDVAIWFDYRYTSGGGSTEVNPTGWTAFVNTPVANARHMVRYRILESGDPGSSVTGLGAGGSGATVNHSKLMICFSPSEPVSTVAIEGIQAKINQVPSISVEVGEAPYILLADVADGTALWSFDVEESPALGTEYAINTMSGGFTLYNSSPTAQVLAGSGGGSRTAISGFRLKGY